MAQPDDEDRIADLAALIEGVKIPAELLHLVPDDVTALLFPKAPAGKVLSAKAPEVQPSLAANVDREALYQAAKSKHPARFATGKQAQFFRSHGVDPNLFGQWLRYQKRKDGSGKLKYPDGSPMALKIVAALSRDGTRDEPGTD
jgi:hypothetical protein